MRASRGIDNNYQNICNTISAVRQKKMDKENAEAAAENAHQAAIMACRFKLRAEASDERAQLALKKLAENEEISKKAAAKRQKIDEENRRFASLFGPNAEPRTQPCHWETLHAFFDQETYFDLDYVAAYLNSGNDSIKKQDLNQVINDLGQYVKNTDNSGTKIYRDTCDYYAYLQQEKSNIPNVRLAGITEQSYRILFAAKCPTHANNNNEVGTNKIRGRALSRKNAKFHWGELLSSAADAVFGLMVGLVAGVSIALTGGLSSPVAIPAGVVGFLGMFGSAARMRDDWRRSQVRNKGISERADKVLERDAPTYSK